MTFLVDSSFSKTAECLDNKRLGCQRLEAWIILRTNLGLSGGWKFHPIVKAWKSYEWALCDYATTICLEWSKRGFVDNMYSKFVELQNKVKEKIFVYPIWITNEKLLRSHRAALLAKNYNWYKKFNWKEKPEINYFWPKNYENF